MKYVWEKASENISMNIKIQAEKTLKDEIIVSIITILLGIAASIYLSSTFIPQESKEIASITKSVAFGIIIPIVIVFFCMYSLVTKIKSYHQAKNGRFMELKTKFVKFGGGGGKYNIGVVVLIMKKGKVEQISYKLIGGMPTNLEEGTDIILLRTECDYDVFIAKW